MHLGPDRPSITAHANLLIPHPPRRLQDFPVDKVLGHVNSNHHAGKVIVMSFLNPTVDITYLSNTFSREVCHLHSEGPEPRVIPPHCLYSHGNLDVQYPLIGAVKKYMCSLFLTRILIARSFVRLPGESSRITGPGCSPEL